MTEGITCYERDETLCEDQMCLRTGCRIRNERLTMTEKNEILLPCPLCGVGPDMLLTGFYYGHSVKQCEPEKRDAVMCLGCGVRAPLKSWNTRAAAASAEPVAWRSIETAPKDGTPVLIVCKWPWPTDRADGRQMAVCWRNGDAWEGGPAKVPGFNPTAWQPLPEV